MDKVLLSTAQYAAHRGVNIQSVRRWIKNGVIRNACVRKGKKLWKIDAEAADRLYFAWREEVAPQQVGSGAAMQEQRAARDNVSEDFGFAGGDAKQSKLAQAKTARETYQAQLARLEYEEKSGDLCKVADVRKERFNTARMVRNSLLSSVARLSPHLRVMKDQHEIEVFLTREFTELLATLSNDLQRD